MSKSCFGKIASIRLDEAKMSSVGFAKDQRCPDMTFLPAPEAFSENRYIFSWGSVNDACRSLSDAMASQKNGFTGERCLILLLWMGYLHPDTKRFWSEFSIPDRVYGHGPRGGIRYLEHDLSFFSRHLPSASGA